MKPRPAGLGPTPAAAHTGSSRAGPAAGLEITREIQDTGYGSRTFTAVDPVSVSWSFGTYPGS